jgi:AhpD family alkylhydroperoxidase
MQPRIKNPAAVIPNAMTALLNLAKVAESSTIPPKTLSLVHLRASQINHCAVCIDMEIKRSAERETAQRLAAVAAWRDAPFFTEAERAALALAESITRLADRDDAVSDEVWAEAARHYDEPQLASLVLYITVTNVWNRLNVATRQVAGAQNW